MTVTFAFLHHLAAFTLVAALAIEFLLIRQEITLDNARKLILVDGIYGAAAAIVLVVGLLRVFYFEKGAAYYFSSHAYLTKFGLFILLAIISAIPTIEFMRWRKAVKAGRAPDIAAAKVLTLRKIIHWEMAGIVFILAAAALMAKGGWM